MTNAFKLFHIIKIKSLAHLHVIALVGLADGDDGHEVTVGLHQVGHVLLHVSHRVVGRPVHVVASGAINK